MHPNLNADYVLAYAKEKAWFGTEKSRYIRHMTDKSKKYPHDDNDGRGKYKLDPIHARNYYQNYTFTFANGIVWTAPTGRYPSYSRETLRQMELENRIDFSNNKPRAKRYLNEVQKGQPPDAFLSPEIVGFNSNGTKELREIFGQGGVFPQPKPTKLLKFLLEILGAKDAIVLDSFAGSGTTAHAVLALNKEDGGNRKFIMVECEDKYVDRVTAERVRRVINGVPNSQDKSLQEGLGGSFIYCTLGDPIDEEGMLTGEKLPEYSDLAAYLLHTASGISVENIKLAPQSDDGFFHSDSTTDYYLLYKPDLAYMQGNDAMLNENRALRISASSQAKNRKAVVFGPGKFIGQRELTAMGITFCQIPYEIHR